MFVRRSTLNFFASHEHRRVAFGESERGSRYCATFVIVFFSPCSRRHMKRPKTAEALNICGAFVSELLSPLRWSFFIHGKASRDCIGASLRNSGLTTKTDECESMKTNTDNTVRNHQEFISSCAIWYSCLIVPQTHPFSASWYSIWGRFTDESVGRERCDREWILKRVHDKCKQEGRRKAQVGVNFWALKLFALSSGMRWSWMMSALNETSCVVKGFSLKSFWKYSFMTSVSMGKVFYLFGKLYEMFGD